MDSDLPVPFPDPTKRFKYAADMSSSDTAIAAAKSMINVLFKWKKMGIDASGNKYSFKKNIESIANALTILEMARELTIEQKEGIIKQLGDGE